MGKRGQGEGSISKRADGRWEAKLSVGYVGGKRKRKVFYGQTRKEVADKLAKALREQQQGLPIVSDSETVGTFLSRWIEQAGPALRPETLRSYRMIVRLHLIPDLGRTKLVKLTPQDVARYIAQKQTTGLSPRTVAYHRAVLRKALNDALRWGEVARNVAELATPPKQSRTKLRFLTPEEARRLLDVVRGHRMEALYTVALAVGLRRGEALGLRWRDIDFGAGTLTVRHALQRVGGKLVLVEPKSDAGNRTIPLTDGALRALREHRQRQLEERMSADYWDDQDFVFASTVGTPTEPRNVNRDFYKFRKATGLDWLRFHDLRHACASLLMAQGVNPRVVMEILGHSQISLTLGTYSHVAPGLEREAVAKLDTILGTA